MYSEDNSEEFVSDEDFEQYHEKDLIISQWANQVIDFSDSYGSESSISYSAVNICGRPSKFPAYGDFAECFSLKKYGPSIELEFSSKDQQDLITFHDFIIVQFENYVLPKEIKIYETYHPGAIVKILAYCCTLKQWKVLWQSIPTVVEKKAREFRPAIAKINHPVRIIRIEFDHSLIEYYSGVDGVLLTGIKYNLQVEKPLSEHLVIKDIIQKKLATVQMTPSEAIEEFLKNDLGKFLENVGLGSTGSKENVMQTILADGCRTEKIINDLPYEVLFNIMSFLDLKSLFQCSQVCKSFREIAADPLLLVELNLKFYWYLVDSSLVRTLAPRCSLMKKLDMSSCGYFDAVKPSDFVELIRISGGNLTHLRLNSSQFLDTSCLEAISISCSNLTELSLRNYMNVTQERDFSSLALLTKLEVLDLSRSGIDQHALSNILRSNSNMQHLNIAFSTQHVNMDEICLLISAFNTKLKSIDMWKCHNLTTLGIRALSQCFGLEEVDFGWCLREEATITDSLKMLMQFCKNLKKLILAAVRGISERDLDNIAALCPNLEQLDLMGIVGVSSEKCKKILDSCCYLKLFDISFCENVDDVNVMIWRNEYKACIKRSEVPNDG